MLKDLNNKAYYVGGSVRDELLGLTPKDIDYCVEATQERFERSFPDVDRIQNSLVYMIDGNEVALTRTEVSTGDGYNDFEYVDGATIEEDLGRRDFTINSIAKHYVTGEIIDPFNGKQDLENKLIRTINKKAFEEDPLRIIRGARFASRFNFSIEEETKELMKKSIAKIETIKKERIVLELSKVWRESPTPSTFFKVLVEIDALKYVINPLDDLRYVTAGPNQYHHGKTAFEHTMDAVDRARNNHYEFLVFIAVLLHDVGKGTTPKDILPHHYNHELRSYDIAKSFLDNHKFSAEIKKTVPMIVRNHMRVFNLTKMKDMKVVRFWLTIKNYFINYVNVVNSDHPLSYDKLDVLAKMSCLSDHRLSDDEIERIKTVKDKHSFYENSLLKFYRRMK